MKYSLFFVIVMLPLSVYAHDNYIDSGFGNLGQVEIVHFDNNLNFEGNDILFLKDGKIAIAGWQYYSYKPVVSRINYNGAPDLNFGTNGFAVLNIPSGSFGQGWLLQELPNQKLLVVSYNGTPTIHVARLLKDGSLDLSFGVNGYWESNINLSFYPPVSDIAVDENGKIVIAGSDGSDIVLFRVNKNGTTDSSFGNGGTIVTDFEKMDYSRKIFLQANGDILLVGVVHDNLGSNYFRKLLFARYKGDGSIDTSFGNGGSLQITLGGSSDYFVKDAMQLDNGMINVTGKFNSVPSSPYYVAQFDQAGNLNPGFGVTGIQEFGVGGSGNNIRIHLLQDNSYVLVKEHQGIEVIRFDASGTINNYYKGATAFVNFPAQTPGYIHYFKDSFLQPDGKVLLLNHNKDAYVRRVDLDSDFDSLPDAWELIHFGHYGFGPLDDNDMDLVPNYVEVFNDTDPAQ